MSDEPTERDVEARVEAVLPPECWVFRTDSAFCTDLVGGTFANGGEWTLEMCCLPCRIRAVLRDTP